MKQSIVLIRWMVQFQFDNGSINCPDKMDGTSPTSPIWQWISQLPWWDGWCKSNSTMENSILLIRWMVQVQFENGSVSCPGKMDGAIPIWQWSSQLSWYDGWCKSNLRMTQPIALIRWMVQVQFENEAVSCPGKMNGTSPIWQWVSQLF